MTQAILGAGGDIGRLLATELRRYTTRIRLVARHPQQVHGDEELVTADLLVAEDADRAVAGADVVYLVAGLKYDVRVWKRDWPVMIRNVVHACIKHGAGLVFFDNVYMYDRDEIPHMTEQSLRNPPSGKGRVRQEVLRIIQEATAMQGLRALIARSADFYGPGAKNGILNTMVLSPLAGGKRAVWQSDAGRAHSFTYTPDAARAVAILGNTAHAYNQEWHLPTSAQRWTGRDFVAYAAARAGQKGRFTLLGPFLLAIAGIFSRTIKELVEMQYQNDRDYFFDSTRFCNAFGFVPTSYEDGIKEVLEYHDRRQK